MNPVSDNPAGWLLFAEVLLLWHAANYLLSADPDPFRGEKTLRSRDRFEQIAWFVIRGLVAGALATRLSLGWRGTLLGSTVLLGCILLPTARWLWIPPRFLAELEILSNGVFAWLAWTEISVLSIEIRRLPFGWPFADGRVAAYMLSAALTIFAVRGGTFIVRGVLNRAGNMPSPELPVSANTVRRVVAIPSDVRNPPLLDSVELNHGRLIGNVERLILVLFVANNEYTAVAFFFAAKGLIRSKDVERRAWADYLILGSLTSFLVAAAIGLLIHTALSLPR